MNWYRVAEYMWTACAACWFVIGVTTGEPISFALAVLCLVCTFAWNAAANLKGPPNGGDNK